MIGQFAMTTIGIYIDSDVGDRREEMREYLLQVRPFPSY